MRVLAYTFEVGSVRCHAIDDGVSTYATASFLFASASQQERESSWAGRSERADAIPCSNTCLLVEAPGSLLLIDTGSGALARSQPGRQNLGRLGSGLAHLDLVPEDIDLVLLTHLHSDHVWGCFGADGKRPIFTSARHVVHREERNGASPSLIEELRRLELMLEWIDERAEIAPGVRLIPAPGHSPGHMAVRIESQGEELLCLGDSVVHPLNLAHPEWTMAHEEDAACAIASRRKLLDMAAERSMLVHAFHMPFPSLARIRKAKGTYFWEPVIL